MIFNVYGLVCVLIRHSKEIWRNYKTGNSYSLQRFVGKLNRTHLLVISDVLSNVKNTLGETLL